MNAPRTERIVRKRGEIRDHALYELARELEDENTRFRAALESIEQMPWENSESPYALKARAALANTEVK